MKRMLINATQPEELRVALVDGQWLYDGDVIPGGETKKELMSRQALHATTLSFDHPITGKRLSFTAPIWEDMRRTIEVLREHRPGPGPIQPAGATVDIEALLQVSPLPDAKDAGP